MVDFSRNGRINGPVLDLIRGGVFSAVLRPPLFSLRK